MPRDTLFCYENVEDVRITQITAYVDDTTFFLRDLKVSRKDIECDCFSLITF